MKLTPAFVLALALVFPATYVRADGGTIRLHREAGSNDAVITLGEVTELTGADAKRLAGVVLMTFPEGAREVTLDLRAIRQRLTDEGINWAEHELIGVEQCTVYRTVASPEPDDADGPTGSGANPPPSLDAVEARTVRGVILEQLAEQAGVDVTALDLEARERDEPTLIQVVVGDQPSVRLEAGRADRWTAIVTTEDSLGVSDVDRLALRVGKRVDTSVAVSPIRRGDVIGLHDVQRREVVVPLHGYDPIPETTQFVGQIAERHLTVGEPLDAQAVRAPRVIHRNEVVAVQLRVGELIIVQPMLARDDGGVGDSIRVQRTDTRQIVHVRVTGRRTAAIDTPSPVEPQVAQGDIR